MQRAPGVGGAIAPERSGFDVVQGLSRDLGAAADVDAVGEAGIRWTQAAVGMDSIISIVRPDAAGRLRVEWTGGRSAGTGRRRSAHRRAALQAGSAVRLSVSDPPGGGLAMVPLVAGDLTVGLLEVVAPSRAIDEAWEILEAIADHVGFALQAMSEREDLRREVDMLERAASLGRDLVKAGSSEDAVRAGVGFVAERLKVPVAGWCGGPNGTLELVAVHGLTSPTFDEFLRAMPSLPHWGSLTVDEKEATEQRFAALAGVRDVSALDVGDAVLLAGTPTQGVEASLEVVGALLAEVLRLRSTAALAERRNEHLDMGIAWTAHELRGPLLGVRAVLELMLEREETGPPDHEILRRSLRELDLLAGTTEALLAWAVGARRLRLRRANLVRVVEQAVESCELEAGDGRVVLHGPERVFARIDPPTLRAALSNLLRNALAYANAGTKVEIEIEEDGGRVLVSVKDRGPMILAAERESIFDPFVRGSAASGGRHSAGLGLFIARRIVEAHRGSIWVESDRQDTTFIVVLPIEQGRARRVAS